MTKQSKFLSQETTTELRITLGENSKLELHTYDATKNCVLYFNMGFVPNPGRILTRSEVNHVQTKLKELGVDYVNIDSMGFAEFDGLNCVRDVLCFGDIFGVHGLVIFYDETLQKWLTEPVSVAHLMHVHQKMNKALNQQFNPMKSNFI